MSSNINPAAAEIQDKIALLLTNIQSAVASENNNSNNVTLLLDEIASALHGQEAAELETLRVKDELQKLRAVSNGDSDAANLTAAFEVASKSRDAKIEELRNLHDTISAYSNTSNSDINALADLVGSGPSSLEATNNALDDAVDALVVHERKMTIFHRERAHRLRDARDRSDIDLAQSRQILESWNTYAPITDDDAKTIAAEIQSQVVNTTRQLIELRTRIPVPNQPSLFDRIASEAETGDNNNILAHMATDLDAVKEELRVAILALEVSLGGSSTEVAAVTTQSLTRQLNNAATKATTADVEIRKLNSHIQTLEKDSKLAQGNATSDADINSKNADLLEMSERLRRERDLAREQLKTRDNAIDSPRSDATAIEKLKAEIKQLKKDNDALEADAKGKESPGLLEWQLKVQNLNEQVKKLKMDKTPTVQTRNATKSKANTREGQTKPGGQNASSDQDSDYSDRLEELQTQNEQFKQGAAAGQDHIEHLQEAIAERDTRIASLVDRVDQREAAIDDLNAAIEYSEEIDAESTGDKTQIACLMKQIEQLQESDKRSKANLKQLIANQAGNDKYNVMDSYREFVEASEARIADLEEQLAESKLTPPMQ